MRTSLWPIGLRIGASLVGDWCRLGYIEGRVVNNNLGSTQTQHILVFVEIQNTIQQTLIWRRKCTSHLSLRTGGVGSRPLPGLLCPLAPVAWNYRAGAILGAGGFSTTENEVVSNTLLLLGTRSRYPMSPELSPRQPMSCREASAVDSITIRVPCSCRRSFEEPDCLSHINPNHFHYPPLNGTLATSG